MQSSISVKEKSENPKQAEKKISVFGLGKVGLTLVSCLSNGGNQVIGVDVSTDLVSSINDRTIDSSEPGVMLRFKQSLDKIFATTDIFEAVENSDLSFIIVPTPINIFGGFSLRFVLEACESIGKAIKEKKGSHVVSLVSTVLPGSSDHLIIPELEKASGRKMGDGIGYCYNPSFIALGEIVKGMELPDYILIGESDEKSGEIVLEAHQSMIINDVPIARMSPIEAEITKLASNTHETMRVSFANMLMATCEETPGTDVDRITGALSHRMGKRFFRGAIPFGGPCWPRDNKALSVFLEALGVPSCMPRNVDIFNEEHGLYILRKVIEYASKTDQIGIVGLAYKSGTHVIECSYAIHLIRGLLEESCDLIVWDPLAMGEVERIMGDQVVYANSGDSCLEEASTIVITQPLRELDNFEWAKCSHKTVIDCWRCLSPSQIEKIGHYIPLGKSENTQKENWFADYKKNKLDLFTQ